MLKYSCMSDRDPGEIGHIMGRAFSEAMGPKLSATEKYNDFLNETKYFNEPFDKRVIKEQTYYIQMDEQDRAEHLMFVELVNVARNKKAPNPQLPPNLDTLGNAGFEGLALDETVKLYNKPGVRVALETIVANFDNDSPLGIRANGEAYSLRTASNKHEVDVCRQAISDAIKDKVIAECGSKRHEVLSARKPEDKEQIERRVREAEQIAFTFAYIGGVFDSIDSEWSNIGRTRAPKCMNEYLVNVPMKLAANPMDWLLSTFKKFDSEVNPVGSFGPWAYEQATKSNGGKPLNIEEVEFIADENNPKTKADFWKVTIRRTAANRRTGEEEEFHKIIVPECYPRKLLRSVFEETTVQVGEDKVPLIDFIRAGEEIPWEDVTTTMWSDFSSKAKKASVISDHLQGRVPIKWGDTDNVSGWVNNINSALSKFGLRKSASVKRWILYSTLRLRDDVRYPMLNDKTTRLAVVASLGEKDAKFLKDKNELLFAWDQPGFFS